jgi:TonB family protein
MRKIMLALFVGITMVPVGLVAAQTPRDTPPPAIEMARRERELRATIAAGTATKETYLELAGLMNRRGDLAKTIEALEKAAELEPVNAEGYHRVATFYWEKANKDYGLSAAEKRDHVLKGLAMEDKALALNPKYMEAMTYKNILLRMQANTTSDQIERARLLAEADALRGRVIEMQRQEGRRSQPSGAPEPPPPPFAGFSETFEQTVARVQPVRVGGDVRQPSKTTDVKPVYPSDAQAAGVQGVVIIEALIDESGSVANARVLRSIPSLDQAALGAVSQWRFTPTSVNGRPAGLVMTVTVNFTLQ